MSVSITDRSPDTGYLPARRVWERYGICSMTLHRWLADKRMNFPKPTYLGRFRYWKLSALQTWERQQTANSREVA